MNVFYTAQKELRLGWKVLRVMLWMFLFPIVFALLASALQWSWLKDYTAHLGALAAVLVELWISRKPLAFAGIVFDKTVWKDLLLGMLWAAASVGLVSAGMLLTGELRVEQFGSGFDAANLFTILLFWFIVAAAEETLFRGYILSMLRQHMNNLLALVLSAAAFMAVHMINPDYYWFAFIYAFLLGVMFGVVVLKRGHLWMVIGFHFAWNLLQGEGLLNMPARGGEIVFAAVLLLNIAITYWLLPHQGARSENTLGLSKAVLN